MREPSRFRRIREHETAAAEGLPDVIGVAPDRMSVIRDDDQILVVTHWIHNGEDVEPEEATVLVAGPSPENKWYTVDLEQFDFTRPQQ